MMAPGSPPQTDASPPPMKKQTSQSDSGSKMTALLTSLHEQLVEGSGATAGEERLVLRLRELLPCLLREVEAAGGGAGGVPSAIRLFGTIITRFPAVFGPTTTTEQNSCGSCGSSQGPLLLWQAFMTVARVFVDSVGGQGEFAVAAEATLQHIIDAIARAAPVLGECIYSDSVDFLVEAARRLHLQSFSEADGGKFVGSSQGSTGRSVFVYSRCARQQQQGCSARGTTTKNKHGEDIVWDDDTVSWERAAAFASATLSVCLRSEEMVAWTMVPAGQVSRVLCIAFRAITSVQSLTIVCRALGALLKSAQCFKIGQPNLFRYVSAQIVDLASDAVVSLARWRLKLRSIDTLGESGVFSPEGANTFLKKSSYEAEYAKELLQELENLFRTHLQNVVCAREEEEEEEEKEDHHGVWSGAPYDKIREALPLLVREGALTPSLLRLVLEGIVRVTNKTNKGHCKSSDAACALLHSLCKGDEVGDAAVSMASTTIPAIAECAYVLSLEAGGRSSKGALTTRESAGASLDDNGAGGEGQKVPEQDDGEPHIKRHKIVSSKGKQGPLSIAVPPMIEGSDPDPNPIPMSSAAAAAAASSAAAAAAASSAAAAAAASSAAAAAAKQIRTALLESCMQFERKESGGLADTLHSSTTIGSVRVLHAVAMGLHGRGWDGCQMMSSVLQHMQSLVRRIVECFAKLCACKKVKAAAKASAYCRCMPMLLEMAQFRNPSMLESIAQKDIEIILRWPWAAKQKCKAPSAPLQASIRKCMLGATAFGILSRGLDVMRTATLSDPVSQLREGAASIDECGQCDDLSNDDELRYVCASTLCAALSRAVDLGGNVGNANSVNADAGQRPSSVLAAMVSHVHAFSGGQEACIARPPIASSYCAAVVSFIGHFKGQESNQAVRWDGVGFASDAAATILCMCDAVAFPSTSVSNFWGKATAGATSKPLKRKRRSLNYSNKTNDGVVGASLGARFDVLDLVSGALEHMLGAGGEVEPVVEVAACALRALKAVLSLEGTCIASKLSLATTRKVLSHAMNCVLSADAELSALGRQIVGAIAKRPLVMRAFLFQESVEIKRQEEVDECERGLTVDARAKSEVQLLKYVQDLLKHNRGDASSDVATASVVRTIGELGAHQHSRRSLMIAVVMLVHYIDSVSDGVRVAAVESLYRVARGQGCSLLQVIMNCNPALDLIARSLLARPALCEQMALTLGMSESELLSMMLPAVLPKLTHTRDTPMLKELSRRLGEDLAALLKRLVHHAIADAMVEEEEKKKGKKSKRNVFGEFIEYVESLMECNFVEHISRCKKELVSEVLWRVGADREIMDRGEGAPTLIEVDSGRKERVKKFLSRLARILIGEKRGIPDLLNEGGTASMLLARFGEHLNRQSMSDDVEHQQAMRCLAVVIDLFGGEIQTYVPKVMALLTRGLELRGSVRQALHGYGELIRRLSECAPALLYRLAHQIFVSILPCFDDNVDHAVHRHAAAVILRLLKLIEESKGSNAVSNLLQSFPALPLATRTDDGSDKESSSAMRELATRLNKCRSSMTFDQRLASFINGVQHESISVRYTSMCELLPWLQHNQIEIYSKLSNQQALDNSSVSLLLEALLQSCNEESRTSFGYRLQLKCSECLGQLGALDPARVNVRLGRLVHIELDDVELASQLLEQHLARVLRYASDLDMLGNAELAVQEILNVHELDVHWDKDMSDSVWSKLSVEVKELIQPCIQTKYRLEEGNDADVDYVGPFFHDRNLSFRKWIVTWLRHLIAHADGPRAPLFRACQGVLKYDMRTMIYLVPRIVHNVVSAGGDLPTQVLDEIMAVLDDSGFDEVKMLSHLDNNNNNDSNRDQRGRLNLATQVVFSIVDHLTAWLERAKDILHRPRSLSAAADDESVCKVAYGYVHDLLPKIPFRKLVNAALRIGAHARALMYFEQHLRDQGSEAARKQMVVGLNPASEYGAIQFESDDADVLREIYKGLEEPDMMTAVPKLRKVEIDEDQTLISEANGQWADALLMYQRDLCRHLESESGGEISEALLASQIGVLRCYLNMGYLPACLTSARGYQLRHPSASAKISQYAIEASWRLGRWDLLEENLSNASQTSGPSVFQTSIAAPASATAPPAIADLRLHADGESSSAWKLNTGLILANFHRKDGAKVSDNVLQARRELMGPLSAATMESYSRAYPILVKLHMLRDAEVATASQGTSATHPQAHAVEAKHWQLRMSMTQPALGVREPIFAFRRAFLNSGGKREQEIVTLENAAKICRKAGHQEAAWFAVDEAVRLKGTPEASLIEVAKQLWGREKYVSAIEKLRGSKHLLSGRDKARACLLLARYAQDLGDQRKEDVVDGFREAVDLDKRWEKSYFYLAKYYEDLFADAKQRELAQATSGENSLSVGHSLKRSKTDSMDELRFQAVKNYASALQHGEKFTHRALMRMLTLWFDSDNTSMMKGFASKTKNEGQKYDITRQIIVPLMKEVPLQSLLLGLPQMISRVCHRNPDTARTVRHILSTLLANFPQRTLWAIAVILQSTIAERRKAAMEIVKKAKKSKNEKFRLVCDTFVELIHQIHQLAIIEPGQKVRRISLSNGFQDLKNIMPTCIIVPTQKQLEVGSSGTWVDEGELVTIAAIHDEVTVFSSQACPKKITLTGSDGKEYNFLAKPKDDLRKDSRMMEFTAMLNRLLQKGATTRRRQLRLRTFAVLPMGEDTGLIEWVSQTETFRAAMTNITCAAKKISTINPVLNEINGWYTSAGGSKASLSEKETWLKKALHKMPALFHRWFLKEFTEPASWFRARMRFTNSMAVWSMVGFIVGLGDRHGENLLVDKSTGDGVQIDFSCLFEKGATLGIPEVVPFRLTQNVIDGFGVNGCEGVYLNAAEATLGLLRANSETLLGLLETFVHDPLVEWTKQDRARQSASGNEKAGRSVSEKHLARIADKLKGVIACAGAQPSVPISVGGQARRLVEEATRHDLLCRMYVWWMPWI